MKGSTSSAIARCRTAGDAEQRRIMKHYARMIQARREKQLQRVESFNRAIRARSWISKGGSYDD